MKVFAPAPACRVPVVVLLVYYDVRVLLKFIFYFAPNASPHRTDADSRIYDGASSIDDMKCVMSEA